jgi:hypothetical protein
LAKIPNPFSFGGVLLAKRGVLTNSMDAFSFSGASVETLG